jgi:hypothetical protein
MTQNNVGIYASQISGHLYDGPYGAYDSLATVTLSSAAADVTFTGIPSGYKHLQIRGIGRSSASSNPIFLQYNGDTTTSNYYSHSLYGQGTTAYAGAEGSTYSQYVTYWPVAADTASAFGTVVIDVLDYQNTNKYKTTRALGGFDTNGGGFSWLNSGLWKNTSAVTSITLKPYSGNFVTYSQFALYGVK